MAKKNGPEHEQAQPGEFPALGLPQLEQLTAGAGLLSETGRVWLKGLTELNTELAGFAQARFQAGVEASRSLSQCKTVQDAVQLQMEFTRESMQSCFDQVTKMTDLATRVTQDCLKPLQQAGNGNGRRARV